MANFATCIECGEELWSDEEQEEGICYNCKGESDEM